MASASGEYSRILQEVCNRMPMCHLIEDDLVQYPEFTKLLLEISQHFDESGLSLDLRKELDSTQNELKVQKKIWLQYEVVHRLLLEMLQEYHCKKVDVKEDKKTIRSPENQFCETLSNVLLVTECTRLLDPSPTTDHNMAPLLGLNKEDVLTLLPPIPEMQQMKEQFQKKLETRLKEKCSSLLTFHQPETDMNSDLLKAMKALQLVVILQDEKRRLQSETEKCKEITALLEKQKMAFPPVQLRCLSLLQKMAQNIRLTAQSEVDRLNVDYYESKCQAMVLKIKIEELQILVDTYTLPKLEVHKMIRDTLEKAICAEEQEMVTSRMLLNAYEDLGPEFEDLMKEYTRLKKDIATTKWALAELGKTSK
ncbi:HAUS augmin-like complex subunit 4 [Ambystoma mexicanum]|uniref:HAUS augmin-like complex subunit 4 n=1 Tax=Ambystoma mexicanum TaxID=8296 RepID=UPI0037E6FB0C